MTSMATATATLTTALPPSVGGFRALSSTQSNGLGCPRCGFDQLLHDDAAAQHRIAELETQIRRLNEKAMTTANKLADYEDEIHSLRVQARKNQTKHEASNSTSSSSGRPSTPTMNPTSPDQASSSPPAQQPQTRLAAFTSFLPYGRRVTNGSTDATSPSSPPRPRTSAADAGLQEALNREQALRKAAESRLTQANSELEDLTAQLFSQANEMVAQERKARMKLEERVEMLERRDNEKRKRLERLEKAIERVARVRGMVDTR